jgi:predicted DNA-binding WGR domain protein
VCTGNCDQPPTLRGRSSRSQVLYADAFYKPFAGAAFCHCKGSFSNRAGDAQTQISRSNWVMLFPMLLSNGRRWSAASRPVRGGLGRSISDVNRWRLIDSSFSLDAAPAQSDTSAMTETNGIAGYKLQMVVLERRNASCNMARFYVLAIEPALFGEMALVREWGRIGSWGCRRLDLHPDRAAAAESLDAWLVRKARRGYRVRLSHSLS